MKKNDEHKFNVANEFIFDSRNWLSDIDKDAFKTVNNGYSDKWSETFTFEMWKVESLTEVKIDPWHFLKKTKRTKIFEKIEWE